jgi:hypothetical protein
MINRDVWEAAVKDVRQDMLDKVSDPDFRRITACVADAYSDQLFEKLNQKLVMILEKDYMSISSKEIQTLRNNNPDKPDWLESLLISFSLEVRDDIFYPEKED